MHGDVRLDGDLLVESIFNSSADASGVDKSAGDLGGLGRRGDAVTGNARLVVDNGDLPPSEAVKEGGLAHIGTSDDGNSGHGKGM